MAKEYLFRLQILNKKNYNPLEVVAFYSGESQFNILNNKKYEAQTAEKVLWNSLIVPQKEHDFYNNLPNYLKIRNKKKDIISNARNILWKSIDSTEFRPDSQFARLFELSIPYFFQKQDAVDLIERFASCLNNDGVIVDASLHTSIANTDHNPSSHEIGNTIDYKSYLICTLRSYSNGRFLTKNREWNQPSQMLKWRNQWVISLCDMIEERYKDNEHVSSWSTKLSIYPEFDTIKANLELKNNIINNSKASVKV